MTKGRILELDGLRAFAVSAVIIFHMTDYSKAILVTNPYISKSITYFGPAGVYVFFIISGFIITTLLVKEKEKNQVVSLKRFYIRRLFRIVPPLVVYTIGLLILCNVGYIAINSQNFLWSYLFLTDFGFLVDPGKGFLAHTWSLSAEEQYYLIFPPTLVILCNYRKKPLTWLLICSFCLCLISLKLAKVFSHIDARLINIAALYKFKYIITGVLLAIYRDKYRRILINRSVVFPIVLPVILILINFIDVPTGLNIITSALEAILWGLWVMWFVENPEKCPMLRNKAIQWIGKCSYSIYLWQQLFVQPADQYNGWVISSSPIVVLPILFCAALSYHFVEKPSIKLARHFSSNAGLYKEKLSRTLRLFWGY